jgi:hypothetical protein
MTLQLAQVTILGYALEAMGRKKSRLEEEKGRPE